MTLAIGTRLTLWYSGVLAAALAGFGLVAWLGMRASLFGAMDADLRERVAQAALAFERGTPNDAFQIRAADGEWVFRSDAARLAGVPLEPVPAGAPPRVSTIDVAGVPHRSVAAPVSIGPRTMTVQLAEPLRQTPLALRRFGELLLVALPAMLLAAAAGGYWISRRALAPVDRIAADARAITGENLSARLAVPHTSDELRRLSETLNAMLARLETAFARLRDFTAGASHELRTPITVMASVADVALRRPRSEAEYREALEQIRGELDRTADLVESLLALARADAGAGLPSREAIDLSAVVERVCAHARAAAAAKGVGLEAPAPRAAVVVSGHRELLQRLLLILLDNAVKYTPSGGRVAIAVDRRDGAACVAVRDTGIGIAPEDLDRVFERFYRADKARTREEGGVGLGLAIGRWIAEAHGGTLTVDSAAGSGSTFTVTLPS